MIPIIHSVQYIFAIFGRYEWASVVCRKAQVVQSLFLPFPCPYIHGVSSGVYQRASWFEGGELQDFRGWSASQCERIAEPSIRPSIMLEELGRALATLQTGGAESTNVLQISRPVLRVIKGGLSP